MLKIGITGGIGSGKTLVCEIFNKLGVPIFSADDEAKKLIDSNAKIKSKIIKHFGKSILNDQKIIDQKKLAAIVFNNKKELAALNKIVHQGTFDAFEKWTKKHKKEKYIIKEAAIMFESGAHKTVDYVITVSAPMAIRINRIQNRDGSDLKQIKARIKNQLSDAERKKRSDFVITNDEKKALIPQVLNIHHKILKLCR